MNKIYLKILYTPLALISVIIFTVGNIICWPLAYFKSLAHKIRIFFKEKDRSNLFEMIIFFIFGIWILLIGQIRDLANFLVHLYEWRKEEHAIKSVVQSMPEKVFV